MNQENHRNQSTPWNKGKLIGQKSPIRLKEIWAIRIRSQMANCSCGIDEHKQQAGSFWPLR
jgi:hypothetical protein